MSLLPIIYTSLLITGSLLIFVVLASYISYKVKNGNRQKISTAMNRNLEFHSKNQTPVVERKLEVSETPEKIKNKIVSRPKPVASAHAPRAMKSNNSTQRRSINSNPHIKTKRMSETTGTINLNETKPDFMKKSSIGKIKNRIEIVNPSQNSNASQSKSNIEDVRENATKRLPANDVLEYYDESGTDYFLLKSAGLASG